MCNRVEIFGIAFPRLTREQLLEQMLERLNKKNGAAICFPDMSTMNLLYSDPVLREKVIARFETYNDGAGLALAARLKGKPFPDNLNGTDFVPMLLEKAPADSRVFLVGGKEDMLLKAEKELKNRFPHLGFVGSHHGYFEEAQETKLIDKIKKTKPDIVLVAMGNPRQLLFIDSCLCKSDLDHTLFFAVGGLLHYFAGDLIRAPKFLRVLRLEWLYIVIQQPHKFRRYFFGIPRFVNSLLKKY